MKKQKAEFLCKEASYQKLSQCMLRKASALIYASSPPPLGGVASIVAILQQGLGSSTDVQFVAPVAKLRSGFIFSLIRSFRNTLRLLWAANTIKVNGRVLIFASDNYSFFEKIIWARLILACRRVPVVVMVAGTFPEFWSRCSSMSRCFFGGIISRPGFQLAVQSDTWYAYYQKTFPLARIGIIGATVSTDFFEHNRPSKSVRPGSLLYVGWIIRDKGITDLLDAMVILLKTNPDTRLRLVGPLFGSEQYWNSALLQRNLSSQVEFVGALADRRALIREFDDASIFVFPSHFEGFPVALLEALTLGLACVATSVGGASDILEAGLAGLLVEPREPEALAVALKELLDSPERIEALSSKAAVRARAVYSHSACIRSYRRILGLKAD